MKVLFISSLLSLTANLCFAQQAQSGFRTVYISKVPKPKAPAVLDISNINFTDIEGNNDNILDAGEQGEIVFEIANKGRGDAYNPVIEIEDENIVKGLGFSRKQFTGNILAGKSEKIKIPLRGNLAMETGKARLKINVIEANGFNAEPAEISFLTQAFKNPELKIADHTFSNKETEGKITLGQIVDLQMIVQNQGQGEAKDISISFTNPNHVFPVDATLIRVNSLKPNESRKINYQFFTNKQYAEKQIAIGIEVKEGYGKYGFRSTLAVSLTETLSRTLQVDVDAARRENVTISQVSLNSDVDRNIPVNKETYANRYALIIGNENYSSYQAGLNSEANVDFAVNDAKAFREYCNKTMGIPDFNIFSFANATAGTMNQEIAKINKIIKNSNGNAEIIFYYAGHGLPDEQTKDAYIFPVDVSGTDTRSAIRLQDVYNKLSEYPSKRVTVFLDACFSGGGRNQGLVAARMIKTKPAAEVINGNIVVFTASSGSETSLPWREKQHGIFTYFLLKSIQETKGNISYQELYNKINNEVKLRSVIVNNKEQNPSLLLSSQISQDWKSWKLQ